MSTPERRQPEIKAKEKRSSERNSVTPYQFAQMLPAGGCTRTELARFYQIVVRSDLSACWLQIVFRRKAWVQEDGLAVEHRHQHFDVADVIFRDGHIVAIKHSQVGGFSLFNRADLVAF